MRKALFIVGPTAVGKTSLAFKISKVIPSVLISADSVQVYRGADIISGKNKTFPTQLLDIIDPTRQFSVRNFVQLVQSIVKEAYSEQKIPIIVGGTGFYTDALFGKIDTINVSPNFKLRAELDELAVKELRQLLKKLNPERFDKMNNSDVNNRRRLIRAIEISYAQGPALGSKPLFKNNETLIIGIKTSMDVLKKRIVSRVDERIKMGAVSESKELFRSYRKLSSQLKRASGYKEL
ncbi:MAG: tRNA (adenosine(37)-N6)-dimethylallyltransferase MiaA, partial [Nanoarchaeota archaeon]